MHGASTPGVSLAGNFDDALSLELGTRRGKRWTGAYSRVLGNILMDDYATAGVTWFTRVHSIRIEHKMVEFRGVAL